MIRTARLRKLPRRRAAVEALEGRQLLTVAFEPAKVVYQGFPIDMQVGDFNGDGRPDLAIATSDANDGIHTFLILPNLGNGTFGAPIQSPGSPVNNAFVVGDFNGDVKLDVAFTPDGHAIDVLPGRGDGTFGAPIASAVTPPGGQGLRLVGTADFNGDGRADILYEGQQSDSKTLGLALGRGDGTFGTSTLLAQQANGPPIIADVNGDGRPDLIIPMYSNSRPIIPGTIQETLVDLNNGDGTLRPLAPIPNVVPLQAGDFNGDGKLDLVATVAGPGLSNDSLAVLPGLGDGTFGPPASELPQPYGAASNAVAADINGDGKLDLATAPGFDDAFPPNVAVLTGKGDGSFRAPVEFSPGLAVSGSVFAPPTVFAADLNGDGKPDLIVLEYPGGQAGMDPSASYPSGVSVLINTSTPQAPVTVSGHLDPASDTGASHTDAITADTTPAFLGQAAPGASIAIFAHRIGSAGTNRVATATAGADGSWRATSSRLPAGAYTITATATLGGSSASATLLGGSKPLQIVTAPPVVTSVVLDPLGGRLIITFAGAAPGGLDRSILKELTAIALSPGFGRNPGRAVTAATLSAPTGPSEAQTLVLTLDGGRRLGPGPYTLVIAGSRIHDIAGNPLDGAFRGSFPSGAGRAGSNFTARFLVGFGRATRPIPLRAR